jgi:hypothetical protein
MTEPPDEATILYLLAELHGGESYQRTTAAETIKIRKILDERLTNELNSLALHDPNSIVRNMAKDALAALGIAPGELGVAKITDSPPIAPAPTAQPGKQLTRNEKRRDFLIGFVGWYVVNGTIWLLLSRGKSSPYGLAQTSATFYNIFIMVGNLGVLLIITGIRRSVAVGILASYAVNFVIAMIFGLMFQAACWIPFFVR